MRYLEKVFEFCLLSSVFACIVFVIWASVVAIFGLHECNSYDYKRAIEIVSDFPELEDELHSFMDDGILKEYEFRALRRQKNDVNINRWRAQASGND